MTGPNDDMKPEKNKLQIRSRRLTSDIYNQVSTFWNRLRKEPTFRSIVVLLLTIIRRAVLFGPWDYPLRDLYVFDAVLCLVVVFSRSIWGERLLSLLFIVLLRINCLSLFVYSFFRCHWYATCTCMLWDCGHTVDSRYLELAYLE